jgi:hypothetical protein
LKVFIGRWATVDLIKAYLHTRSKDGKTRRVKFRRSTPAPDNEEEVYEVDTGFAEFE